MRSATRARITLLTAIFAAGAAPLLSCQESAERGDYLTADDGTDDLERGRGELRDIMKAKLTHSRMLLEAMAVGDFGLIAQNALELSWLSRQAEWYVHDSPEYRAFSERFRDATERMVEHAAGGQIDEVSNDYTDMSATCLDCHAYLRREGLVKELPGMNVVAHPRRLHTRPGAAAEICCSSDQNDPTFPPLSPGAPCLTDLAAGRQRGLLAWR